MKYTIDKKALKEYISEIMSNPGIGWSSPGESGTAPANVSPVVDPSASITGPDNPNFKPQNKKELEISIPSLIADIEDEAAPGVYDAIKDAIIDNEENKQMSDEDKKVEESIRLQIRKLLREAPLPPVKKIPAGVHGGEYMRNLEKLKRMHKQDPTFRSGGDEESEEDTGTERSRKNVMMTDVGGASFKQIAQELGFASESGAKQFAEKAMEKAQFAANMDPDELAITTLLAMKDYINFLKKSGELTSADVQLMHDHPSMVAELDGFRDFLHKYIKREMKKSGSVSESTKPTVTGVVTGRSEGKERMICQNCRRPFSLRDKSNQSSKICSKCSSK